jgi:hypothetical protein
LDVPVAFRGRVDFSALTDVRSNAGLLSPSMVQVTSRLSPKCPGEPGHNQAGMPHSASLSKRTVVDASLSVGAHRVGLGLCWLLPIRSSVPAGED